MKASLLFAVLFGSLGFGAGWVVGMQHATAIRANYTPAEARLWQQVQDCRAEHDADVLKDAKCDELVGASSALVDMLKRTRGTTDEMSDVHGEGARLETAAALTTARLDAPRTPAAQSQAVHPMAQMAGGAPSAPRRTPR